MRLSDILKRKMGQPEKQDPEKNKAQQNSANTNADVPSIPLQISKAMAGKDKLQEEHPGSSGQMHFVKAMKDMETSKEDLGNLYNNGILISKDMLRCARESKAIDLNPVKNWIGDIVDICVLGNKELQGHFYEQDEEYYLCRHMVNASIMAVELGLDSGYNKSKLNELGLAAFLYDIGMVKVENSVLHSRPLSKREQQLMKEHTGFGFTILSQVKDLPEWALLVAKQHHERSDGKGYPSGLKGPNIIEYSRLISIIDVYEALTHRRTYRKEYTPHEAVKVILTELCSSFDQVVLKCLIGHVGIYPIGSWVELNTDELGKVIAANDEFPLRPIVKLLFDNAGNRLSEPKIINLSKQSNLFIKRPICDKDITCNKECL